MEQSIFQGNTEIEPSIKILAENLYKEEQDEILSIIVRGSYVKGTLTVTSDIDILAITKTKGPSAEFRTIGNLIFHVRKIPLSEIQFEIRRINPRYLGFIYYGRPIIDPSGIFQLLKNLVYNLPKKEPIQRFATEGHHQFTDAIGHFKAGNYESAMLLLRKATIRYIQALLFAFDILSSKEKDVPIDLKKINIDEVKNLFDDIMGFDNLSEEKVKNITNKVERLLHIIGSIIQDKYGFELLEKDQYCW